MFLNDILTRVEMSGTDAGMGYSEKSFTGAGEVYKVDRQPYSPELAKKQYGLSDSNIKIRCFTEKKGLASGDYVKCGGAHYVVLLVNDWENHSEIILGGA